MEHIGVLTKEIISFLNIKSTGKYLDCTLGSGDHSINVLRKLSSDGELWCIDIYKKAIKQFKKKYKEEICKKNIFFINDNFINIKKYVSEKKFDGIIADIGLSYDLINDPEYSLSYNKDSILNMNYLNTDKHLQFILNKYSREKLVKIFFKYGNEKYSKSISKNICKIRKDKKIINNYDLIKIIKMSTPANYFYKNMPQKRIFQALRIYINDELENLKKILKIGSNLLNNGGKFLIISFNSEEDRIIKKYICKITKNIEHPVLPIFKNAEFEKILKKYIAPTVKEIESNKFSKCAKLRGFKKI